MISETVLGRLSWNSFRTLRSIVEIIFGLSTEHTGVQIQCHCQVVPLSPSRKQLILCVRCCIGSWEDGTANGPPLFVKAEITASIRRSIRQTWDNQSVESAPVNVALRILTGLYTYSDEEPAVERKRGISPSQCVCAVFCRPIPPGA